MNIIFKILIVNFIAIINFLPGTEQTNAIKDFQVHRIQKCGDEKSFMMHMEIKSVVADKDQVSLDGFIRVDEDVPGDLVLDLNVTRCDVDKKNCEHFERLEFRGICGKLGTESMFGAEFVKGMTPPLECPIKKGIYQFNNGTIDMKVVSHFPIHGFHWQAITKFLTTETPPRNVLCIEEDVTIVHVNDK